MKAQIAPMIFGNWFRKLFRSKISEEECSGIILETFRELQVFMSIFTYPNGGLVFELYSEYVYMAYFKISYLYKLLKNCASQRSNMINSKETACSRVLAKQGLGGLSPSCKAWRGSVSAPSPEILHLATFLEYR